MVNKDDNCVQSHLLVRMDLFIFVTFKTTSNAWFHNVQALTNISPHVWPQPLLLKQYTHQPSQQGLVSMNTTTPMTETALVSSKINSSLQERKGWILLLPGFHKSHTTFQTRAVSALMQYRRCSWWDSWHVVPQMEGSSLQRYVCHSQPLWQL